MQKTEFKQSLLVKHVEDTKFAPIQANNGAPRPPANVGRSAAVPAANPTR